MMPVDISGGAILMSMKLLPRWTIFFIGVYVGAGLLTFGFNTWLRLEKCFGIAECGVSLAKGAAWSPIWPAYWPVKLIKESGKILNRDDI
jgi:hypothetical protein